MAPGAQLVQYMDHAEQLSVELYFRTKGPLPAYWVGVARAAAADPYAYVDGSPVPQVPSPLLDLPYAHWAWPAAALAANATANLSCVAADPAFTYDRFLGSDPAAEAANASLYEANAAVYYDRKYGWVPASCSSKALMPFICKAEPAAFPCADPPSPPPPPPSPVSPPVNFLFKPNNPPKRGLALWLDVCSVCCLLRVM
jgi:hypothetical protein